MSRLTGADAYGLMEAYQAVYTSQELTEEQVWEEVETWVNSLLEEGYDLSDYTWEEMYEEYLTEMGFNPAAGKPAKPKGEVVNLPKVKGAITGGDVTLNRGYASTLGGQKGEVTYQKKDNVVTRSFRPTGVALDPGRFDREKARLKNVGNPPAANQNQNQNQNQNRNRNLTATTPASPKVAPTKPASPTAPARPSSSATASTADKIKGGMEVYNTQKKAGDMKGAAETGMNVSKMKYGDQLKPKTPNPLMQKTFGYQTGNSPKEQQSRADKIVQSGAVKALAPTPAAKVTPAATPSVAQRASGLSLGSSQFKATAPEVAAKTTPTPVTPKAPTLGSKKPGSMVSHFDVFDVIKGHLLDEGYADTEESALAIMANMSEEWRESIVEGLVDAVASGAGTVVGTAQRAAREIPKYVQQKVNNVAGTYERARQRADANAPSGGMTTNPRSREFSHGNQGGKPAPMKPMRNPGPNFGRG